MKTADYKKTFYRALTLKGTGSLQGLSIGKVTDLEGAEGYKLVAGLHEFKSISKGADKLLTHVRHVSFNNIR